MAGRIAILDTNIFQYGFDNKYSSDTARFLDELSTRYELTSTQYGRFELFRGLNHKRIATAKAFFDTFTCLDINGDVFKAAAALATCYKNDKTTKNFHDRYSDGDILIAAAAFINNADIVTANINDFPRPYFKETAKDGFIESHDRKALVRIQVLKPDTTYLNLIIKQIYPTAV